MAVQTHAVCLHLRNGFGRTFTGWSASGMVATDVQPNGSTSYELPFLDSIISYRAFKFPWNFVTSVPTIGEVPTTYSLYRNYPNPFDPFTNIGFSLPQAQFVSLKVYSVHGKEIASLLNSTMFRETYTVQWNADNTSSGVYFYQLTASPFTMTRKLILLR